MPKLCDGANGKKNTSVIGKGHIALYVVQLETYNVCLQHIMAAKQCGGYSPQPPSPPALACLPNDLSSALVL